MRNRNIIFGSLFFLLGLLTALTPLYILPVCEYQGKARMACTYMGKAEVFMGVVLISLGVGAFLSKASLRGVLFPALIAGISIIVMPEIIGYCPSIQMPCHYGTVPLLRFTGGIAALTAIVGFVFSKENR